jgi:hypothetical protein
MKRLTVATAALVTSLTAHAAEWTRSEIEGLWRLNSISLERADYPHSTILLEATDGFVRFERNGRFTLAYSITRGDGDGASGPVKSYWGSWETAGGALKLVVDGARGYRFRAGEELTLTLSPTQNGLEISQLAQGGQLVWKWELSSSKTRSAQRAAVDASIVE